MHWFPCFNGRRALMARRPISIGFSSNLSSSLYSGLSVRVLVSADNPKGGSTNSISSSRPHQLKRVCISQLPQFELVQRSDLSRTVDLISSNTRFIAKIHGSISSIETLVFKSNDYDTVGRD